MSAPIKPHAVHPSGGQIIALDDLGHPSIVVGPTVPTAAGYGIGCLFIHSDGAAGTALYVNEGTASSTSFVAINTAGGAADVSLDDDADLTLGTGTDALMRWSTGDASNHALVVALGDSNQALHVTDKAAVGTDWNISATTHPTVYVHSNTTPATDYLLLGNHDGTTANIDVVGGTTLALAIAGTTALSLAASALTATVAFDLVGPANTAAIWQITDGTTAIVDVDSRNTLKDIANVKLTGVAPTVASAAEAHINPTLQLAAKTITYTGTTGTTSSLGAALHVGIQTWTDASAMTLTTASAVHIAAIAAAGGSLTITNSRMISTSVSDAFLTNAGVWTDTACWESGKEFVSRAADSSGAAIDRVLASLTPATWKYKSMTELPAIDSEGNPTIHRTPINDRDRERVGIVYDDLPEELRAPGEERAVSAGLLASFALAAIKRLSDRNAALEARLAALESA